MLLAFFGGLYNNYLALDATIADARRRGGGELYCLGDLGAFGPHPDRVFPLLREHGVTCIQGNYDHSVGNGLDDCRCGYTDPRDNLFAQISYDYTFAHTSPANREWLRALPPSLRLEIDGVRFLLCHGSPRKTNEFLWESTTSTQFLDKLTADYEADVILGTHTGLHWRRELPSGRQFVNVGVLGRPENDGTTRVWYTLVRIGENDRRGDAETRRHGEGETPQVENSPRLRVSASPCLSSLCPSTVDVEFIPIEYDHKQLAFEMRQEKLPEEFVETILTGWWTTCLEVLPAKERQRGKY
jgi:diadenosine tetraphosphatase ApaH/serine/threonine PP2A family protein phosphatase